MNTFLLFVILLIFIYEFIKRIKYIEESDTIEKFEDIPITKMTYLPANFNQEYLHDLDVKDISKDLGVKRSINQVKSAYDEDTPPNFFKPLDINLFRRDLPKWIKSQRPWIESYTYFDQIIDQKEAIKKFRKNNPELLNTYDKLGLTHEFINPIITTTPNPSSIQNPIWSKIEVTSTWNGTIAPTKTPIPKPQNIIDITWIDPKLDI
jgi:hypothetical protein